MEMEGWSTPESVGTTGKPLDRRGVVHPVHYNNHPSGVEANDIMTGMVSNVSNSFKYVFRRGQKVEQGKTVQQSTLKDLDKASWYLENEGSTQYLCTVRLWMPHHRDRLLRVIQKEQNPYAVDFYEGLWLYSENLSILIGGNKGLVDMALKALKQLRTEVNLS